MLPPVVDSALRSAHVASTLILPAVLASRSAKFTLPALTLMLPAVFASASSRSVFIVSILILPAVFASRSTFVSASKVLILIVPAVLASMSAFAHFNESSLIDPAVLASALKSDAIQSGVLATTLPAKSASILVSQVELTISVAFISDS